MPNVNQNVEAFFRGTSTVVSQEVNVLSWSPDTVEKNTPSTEVHMVCTVFKFAKAAFIVRIKSRKFCQSIINALQSHMDEVRPVEGDPQ